MMVQHGSHMYDDTFRRQAAGNKQKIWSNINSSLISLCFTSKARTSRRCEFCFISDHMNGPHQCSLQEDGEVMSQQQNAEVTDGETVQGAGTIWCRFNEGRCTLLDFSYQHVCTRCGGRHPVVSCKQGASNGGPPNHSRQKGSFRQQPY